MLAGGSAILATSPHPEMARRGHGLAALAVAVVFQAGAGFAAAAGERSLAAAACPRETGEPVTLAEALAGDLLRLADGRVVRLAGIDAPRASLTAADAGAGAL